VKRICQVRTACTFLALLTRVTAYIVHPVIVPPPPATPPITVVSSPPVKPPTASAAPNQPVQAPEASTRFLLTLPRFGLITYI